MISWLGTKYLSTGNDIGMMVALVMLIRTFWSLEICYRFRESDREERGFN